MIINDNDVSLIAKPKTLFKIIQIINQWIDNIVHHYKDQSVINNEQTWYRKWKVLYPIICSSKRSVIEVYRFITEDLLAPTASVLDVLNQFLDTIPELSTYQTLTSIDDKDINPNYMRYTLRLYYTPCMDPNNQFASIASNSIDNYCTFKDNKSIMTWNTTMSAASIASVPSVVTTTKPVIETSVQIEPKIADTPVSSDSNISLLDTKLSPTAILSNQDTRKQKLNKKSDDLKSIIAISCKQEIGKEMQQVQSELDNKMNDLKLTIEDSITDNYVKLEKIISNALHNLSVHHHQPNITVSSILKANQPSPRTMTPKMTMFKFDDTDDMDQKTQPSKMDNSFKDPMQCAFQKSGTLVFYYDENMYELRDGDFNKLKSTFTSVETKSDLIILYKQLHGMAIAHNIFLQVFESLVPWDKNPNSITPTCIFTTINTEENTVDAYQRMKSALYHKLTQVTFKNQEYHAIVEHGKTEQDGFNILYDLMTLYHPKLVAITNKYRNINEKPTFDRSNSIYSFCNKLQSWLDIECINNHIHTEDDIINMVLEQLRADTRYNKAVESITQQLTFNDTFQRQLGTVVFPDGLKLRNLPGTIMSYYSPTEKLELFPMDDSKISINKVNDENMIEAIINSLNG
jgi:hypothetical protein